MVNMGAIVMCSLIHGRSYDERFQRLLELTRRLAGDWMVNGFRQSPAQACFPSLPMT